MQLLVNDEPRVVQLEPRQTLRELAQSVCPDEGPESSLIVSVECDGRSVPLDGLDAALDAPAEQFGEVAFQTQPVRALIVQSLGEAIRVFRLTDHARVEAADLIAAGQQQSALAKLASVFADWKQVQDAVALVIQALGPLSDGAGRRGGAVQTALAPITAQLRELKSALEAGDLVLVGDILRFELEQPFADWIAALEGMQGDVTV